MAGQGIECDIVPAKKLLGKIDAVTIRVALDAAGAGVRNAAIKHFRTRNSEPANSDGFPRFGESYPKSNFWANVAKAVSEVVVSGSTAIIAIDSPALAHKADTNPPVIKPKGGRRYLAIPANARAAAYAGMPRDFLGGSMRFGFAVTPDGIMMPALLATRDHLKTFKKGKKAGQRAMATLDKQQTSGHGDVQYWLVRKVQTRHDPNALPSNESLTTAATRAAQTALNQLSKG